MPRRTRKQLVGKQLENNECRERELDLRTLAYSLRLAWYRQVADQVIRGGIG